MKSKERSMRKRNNKIQQFTFIISIFHFPIFFFCSFWAQQFSPNIFHISQWIFVRVSLKNNSFLQSFFWPKICGDNGQFRKMRKMLNWKFRFSVNFDFQDFSWRISKSIEFHIIFIKIRKTRRKKLFLHLKLHEEIGNFLNFAMNSHFLLFYWICGGNFSFSPSNERERIETDGRNVIFSLCWFLISDFSNIKTNFHDKNEKLFCFPPIIMRIF